MKLFALALLSILSTTAAEAACPHSRQQFICPGDPVVDQYNRPGQATAMNPFQKTVAYRLGSGSIASTDISNMSLGVGCLEAFCVGDQVVDQYNRPGIVVAVNPYQSSIAYRLGSGSIASTALENMLIGMGCNQSYCVGDGIVDQYNRPGLITALSPYNDMVGYRLGSGSTASTDIQNLSNTNFCEEYGESHRSRRRFPELPRNRYAAPDFKYYSRR